MIVPTGPYDWQGAFASDPFGRNRIPTMNVAPQSGPFGSPQITGGLFGSDPAQNDALMAAAATLLSGSGYSTTPTSSSEIFGKAMLMSRQVRDASLKAAQERKLQEAQIAAATAKTTREVDAGDATVVLDDQGNELYRIPKNESPSQKATRETAEAGRLAQAEQNRLGREVTMRGQDIGAENARLGREAVTSRAVQAREGEGQKAVDRKFGKDYADYVSGGAATAQQALDELRAQSVKLDPQSAEFTQASGPLLGAFPNFLRKRIAGPGFAIQQNIERNIQASLRQVLGAQYTQIEGENLLARTFDPSLDESENKKRLDSLITRLDRAKTEKDRAVEYFRANGTLEGFHGKTDWTAADFAPSDLPEVQPSEPGPTQPASGAITRINNDADFEALPHGAEFIDPNGKRRRKP